MAITVCTVSGKGGTGKSTVSSGLAIAAGQRGKRVLMIDLDAGLRCLDTMFGIDDKVVFDLSDILSSGDIQKALYPAANYSNIFIVPAPAKPEKIDFAKLKNIVGKLENDYDLIVLDFPAGADFEDYSYFADAYFLTVSSADDVSIKAAAVIASGLDEKTNVRLIINRFDKNMIRDGFYKNIDNLIDISLTRLIGIVPADGELLLFGKTHKISRNGRAVQACDRIFRRISGEDVKLPKLKKI